MYRPMIYSRFDIVWPDTLNSTEPRAGVDALTYGLATLVMREDLFGNPHHADSNSIAAGRSFQCTHCGLTNLVSNRTDRLLQPRQLRRGNFFSQFVKKFSLGNGPPDWVQEYLVTKESGKMLGTLVALSLARMPNLVRRSHVSLNEGSKSLLTLLAVGILHLGYAHWNTPGHMDLIIVLRRS